MLALQLDHWLFTQALHVADCTKRVCILLKSLFIILSYTLFMQTRRMFLFTIIPIAIMIAVQECLTAIFGLLLAPLLRAAIRITVLSQWSPTKPALLGLLIFLELRTCLSYMIRLLLAPRAEVLLALRAPDSIHAHVLLRSLADILAIVVFEGTHLSLKDFNHVAAGALHKVQLALQGFTGHFGLQVVVGLLAQDLPDFRLEKLDFTVMDRTERFGVVEVDRVGEALLADHVIAVLKIRDIGEVQKGLVTVPARDTLVYGLHK
jgi:hypothetical protein